MSLTKADIGNVYTSPLNYGILELFVHDNDERACRYFKYDAYAPDDPTSSYFPQPHEALLLLDVFDDLRFYDYYKFMCAGQVYYAHSIDLLRKIKPCVI